MRDVPPSRSELPSSNGHRLEVLEIDTGKAKRWKGWIGWILLVLLVAGLLVALFIRFTGSMRLAVVLVGFMMAYMGVMGAIASSKADDRG